MAEQVTKAQALTVTCPACQSLPGKDCTQATENGRKPVTWVHLVRESEFMFPTPDADGK